MKSLIAIVAGFVIAVLVLAGVALNSLDRIPKKYLPPGSSGYYLYNLDRRVKVYKKSSPGFYVILGPSYVRALGFAPQMFNLSLTAARFNQMSAILPIVKSTDTPLYCFSLRECLSPYTGPDIVVASRFLRCLSIYRSAFDAAMHPKENRPNRWKASEEQIAVLDSAMDLDKVANLNKGRAIRHLQRITTAGLDQVTIDHLLEVRNEYPQAIFIYFPLVPMSRVDGDSELARDLNFVAEREAQLRKLLAASDLPLIDLSTVLRPEHYVDPYHHTQEGTALVKAEIIARLNEMKAAD